MNPYPVSSPQARRGSKPPPGLNVDDIQAILASGFPKLAYCRYLLLQIVDPAGARNWLKDLLDSGAVLSAGEHLRGAGKVESKRQAPCVATVAFSFRGLEALGIHQDPQQPFPSGFARGMTDPLRSQLLGDDRLNRWEWVDAPDFGGGEEASARMVHIFVALLSEDGNHGNIPDSTDPACGLKVVRDINTCPRYLTSGTADEAATMTEPFGFRDGISQPRIEGLSCAPGQRAGDDHLVKPGEFILGYSNEYGEPAYCPDVTQPMPPTARATAPFGINGSYLVARQIWQDVAAFRQFEQATARAPGESGPSVAEKMMGRYKCGEPLVQCPFTPHNKNDFRYRQTDLEGFQCPRGAHVRRANPRDLLGWDTPSGIAASRLHRLLRRGRVYASSSCKGCAGNSTNVGIASNSTPQACKTASHPVEACGQGLMFVALNADIERQFEIVQTRWLADRQFNDLEGEDDLMVPTAGDRRFSLQGLPVGQTFDNRVSLASFTQVIGGGYFFLPGLNALRRLAHGIESPALTSAPEPGHAAEPGTDRYRLSM